MNVYNEENVATKVLWQIRWCRKLMKRFEKFWFIILGIIVVFLNFSYCFLWGYNGKQIASVIMLPPKRLFGVTVYRSQSIYNDVMALFVMMWRHVFSPLFNWMTLFLQKVNILDPYNFILFSSNLYFEY